MMYASMATDNAPLTETMVEVIILITFVGT